MIGTFDGMLQRARQIKGKRIAVIYPNNDETFAAISEARAIGLAEFLLVGDPSIIRKFIPYEDAPPDGINVIEARGIPGALARAIKAVTDGEADVLLKGGVDTSSMMKALLKEDAGIRTSRLLSDIFVLEYPERLENKFVMITDGGMTMAPDLKNKVELINNAVEVAHALGNAMPKVAVLSATEFVLPNLPSTLDAAALSKMNERGQITGCLVDGPFALDNAISADAASEKRINSPVAGHAEILVAANIESANSLAKSTTYFANLRLAHVIVGGRVPILIPSRADRSDAKLLSIALGVIMSDYYQVHSKT